MPGRPIQGSCGRGRERWFYVELRLAQNDVEGHRILESPCREVRPEPSAAPHDYPKQQNKSVYDGVIPCGGLSFTQISPEKRQWSEAAQGAVYNTLKYI